MTLWNAAIAFKNKGLYGILTDDTGSKLESFITTVLTPLVEATKDHIALGAWDIINEPEGSILPQSTQQHRRCTDTGYLQGTGLPFPDSDVALPVHKYQKFINHQASAIKVCYIFTSKYVHIFIHYI